LLIGDGVEVFCRDGDLSAFDRGPCRVGECTGDRTGLSLGGRLDGQPEQQREQRYCARPQRAASD
jgi:hypothetical protein